MNTKRRGARDQFLVADVGGTNARFALYRGAVRTRLAIYASEAYASPEAPLLEFLDGQRVAAAVIAVAGPVVGGQARLTNVPWVVREKGLSRAMGGAPVRIINDLVAVGLGCLHASKPSRVRKGTADPSGNVAVVAPGTGLGEAIFVRREGTWIPVATEGAHVDFAATDDTEWRLRNYLAARYGHVSYERVVSGRGLADIYSFFIDVMGRRESKANRRAFEDASDRPAFVTALAKSKRSRVALEAVDCFLGVYGSEAGNLALKSLATGGVFLSGNIVKALSWRLSASPFISRFLAKGQMQELVARIPVLAVTDSHAGLSGSAYYARQLSLVSEDLT